MIVVLAVAVVLEGVAVVLVSLRLSRVAAAFSEHVKNPQPAGRWWDGAGAGWVLRDLAHPVVQAVGRDQA